MRRLAFHTRGGCAALASLALLSSVAHAEGDAAHALAQKFAVEDSAKNPAARPNSPAPGKAATATAPAPTLKPKAAANSATQPARPNLEADEKEMLEAARAEAAARQAAPAGEAQAAPKAPTPPGRSATQAGAPAVETKPASTTPAPAANTAQQPTTAVAAPAAAAVPTPPAPPAAQVPTEPGTAKSVAGAGTGTGTGAGGQATVLVVSTLHTAAGDTPKTFDPVLCSGSKCFVSTGPATAVRPVARDVALSTKNTIGDGAGACEGQLGCIFRDVPLEAGATLQVIDLGLVEHKAHEPFEAHLDATCSFEESELICRKPVTTPDYRLWIVPEALAAKAGAERLTGVLDSELPEENVTLESDK